ncbi:peptidase M30, partial [Brachyspira hampsonii]|nr:peptidase M30 [Brachyspira hampsonii]
MKKILCVIAISILYIISCNRNNVTSPIELIEGLTYPNSSMYSRNFRILSIDSAGNEDLSASAKFYRIAEYDKLDIYIEENEGYRKENIDYIVSEFNKHYDEEIRIYGNHTDVDGNNKIIIVLYDIKNYTGGNINGFFHYFDLMKDRLNNGEILYMNIKVVNQDADYMSGTILHELQHLINWNVNYIKNGSEMSTWLNEALSESTSVVFNEATASSRIFEFKNMNGYYCFYTWNLPTEKV